MDVRYIRPVPLVYLYSFLKRYRADNGVPAGHEPEYSLKREYYNVNRNKPLRDTSLSKACQTKAVAANGPPQTPGKPGASGRLEVIDAVAKRRHRARRSLLCIPPGYGRGTPS